MVILPSLRSAEVVEWTTGTATTPASAMVAWSAGPLVTLAENKRRSAVRIARIIAFSSVSYPSQCLAEELNLVLQFRTLPCSSGTLARRIAIAISRPGVEPGPGPSEGPMRSATPSGSNSSRADDWIRTSINRFTRQAPFSVEPRRQSTSARSRTPSGGFGDRLLSQEHTRVRPTGTSPVGDQLITSPAARSSTPR